MSHLPGRRDFAGALGRVAQTKRATGWEGTSLEGDRATLAHPDEQAGRKALAKHGLTTGGTPSDCLSSCILADGTMVKLAQNVA